MALPKNIYVYVDNEDSLLASYDLPEDVIDQPIGRYTLETKLKVRAQLQEKKRRSWKDVD